jgi:hypothetical protein
MAAQRFEPTTLTSEQLSRLANAFDRVRDPRDWKAPIHALIPAAERPIVEEAVRWFTFTVPVFAPVPGEALRLEVSASGYRRGLADAMENRR